MSHTSNRKCFDGALATFMACTAVPTISKYGLKMVVNTSPTAYRASIIPRLLSTHIASQKEKEKRESTNEPTALNTSKGQKKTIAELDEELRAKLEGRSGEGGAAGLELENGQPVAMKRGVKNNMFRLI